ncbi:MAG: hypothetical protein IJE89_05390 [Bacilli bacterium]|nr:hypothetical protein [Bacilli bacterium]MBQ9854539.1 hypothetical protein [Bacilli bacterium]
MKKYLLIKYILLYLPFVVGVGLYSFGIYNLASSLLLFIGGYISIKNTFDYRKVNKNINSINSNNDIKKVPVRTVSKSSLVCSKKIKKIPRVRKRTKY